MKKQEPNSTSKNIVPHLSPEFRRDLKAIQKYIGEEQESPQNALKVIDAIFDRIENLLTFPDTGTLLASKVNFETNYRYATAKGYLIFYRHEKNTVFVDRVIHGRRDYISILFPELKTEDDFSREK